jgi:predicted  nucleic acid-binding Zn-ribbon protein
MRHLTISISLIIFALTLCAAAKNESVDQLKSRVESARPEDRPGLCMQIAHLQLGNADKLYKEGKAEQARAAVDDIVTYSEKARDAASQTRKHLKNVEIEVRKISERLHDIKRTLAFDDQPPVDQAIKRLEDIRTALLKEMFAKEKK